MTKKKVTAPLTYNPGKGRPKEHLAYLNKGEMKALRLLNGNNVERGPSDLPSFPPADAIGSSSRASSSKPSGSSSVSRISGGTAGSNAARSTSSSSNRSSSSGGGGGRDSGQAANRSSSSSSNRSSSSGGGGARDSGQAANRPASSPSRPSSSGGGGARDSGQAANRPPSGGGARDSGQATARSDVARYQADAQRRAQNLIGDLGRRYNLPAYNPPAAQNYSPLRPSGSLTNVDKSYLDQARDFINRTFYGDGREGLQRIGRIENAMYSTLSGLPVPASLARKIGSGIAMLPSYIKSAPMTADDFEYMRKTIEDAAPYMSGAKISVPNLPSYPSLAVQREAIRIGKNPAIKALEAYDRFQSKIDNIAYDVFGDVAKGRAALTAGAGIYSNMGYDLASGQFRQNSSPSSQKQDFAGSSSYGEKGDFQGSGMKSGGVVRK